MGRFVRYHSVTLTSNRSEVARYLILAKTAIVHLLKETLVPKEMGSVRKMMCVLYVGLY
jgi:hypothetical protein